MLSEHDLLTWGYWPAREQAGLNPPPIRFPDEYDGGSTLCLACTQTGLAAAKQRKLVAQWCELLPNLPLKALLFRSKVNQALFEAATRISGLEALFVKWSSIQRIDNIAECASLQSLYVGSSPSLTGLGHLAALPSLRHLFIRGVSEARHLEFVRSLSNLDELGLAGESGRKLVVDSLQPVAELKQLRMLWLVSLRVENGGWDPLHRLPRLVSLRTERSLDTSQIQALRAAVPSLQRFQPVWR